MHTQRCLFITSAEWSAELTATRCGTHLDGLEKGDWTNAWRLQLLNGYLSQRLYSAPTFSSQGPLNSDCRETAVGLKADFLSCSWAPRGS